ncbi:MAG: hypothetical protein ACXW05_08865 [Gemmatirosa sp.]
MIVQAVNAARTPRVRGDDERGEDVGRAGGQGGIREVGTELPVGTDDRTAMSHGTPDGRPEAFGTRDDDSAHADDTSSTGGEPVEPILQMLVHGFNMRYSARAIGY